MPLRPDADSVGVTSLTLFWAFSCAIVGLPPFFYRV